MSDNKDYNFKFKIYNLIYLIYLDTPYLGYYMIYFYIQIYNISSMN